MKTTPLFRVMLVLCALLVTLAVFAACNQTPAGGDETSGGNGQGTEGNPSRETTGIPTPTLKINIADYTLLIPDAASEQETDSANALIAAAETIGAAFKSMGTDFVTNTSEIDPNAYELLVGATNRPESANALTDLGGKIGYVVKLVGNKIVINASAPALLDEAVNCFISEYISKGASGTFEIPETLSVTNTDVDGVALLDGNGLLQFRLIYQQSLDTTSGSSNYDRVDYVVQIYMDLYEDFTTRFPSSNVSFEDDRLTADAESYELLLGMTNRPETMTFLNSLAINEYGYGVVGNKIVVAGWSDLTIYQAVELFMNDLDSYRMNDGNFIMFATDKKVATKNEWDVSVPLYNAGNLSGVIELQENSYEALYEGTNASEYTAYCADLLTKGYKLHQENQIGNNLYKTFYNSSNMIHVYYMDYLKAVRFITESMSTAILPQNTDKAYEKVTETTFTMMDLDAAAGVFGNSFIITLEDGSFILHDGGGDLSRNTAGVSRPAGNEHAELFRLLQHLNKRPDGKIVIAAWIISHQHWDHIKNSIDMFKARYRDLKLERIIYNVAAPSMMYNTYNPEKFIEKGNLKTIALNTGCDLLRMHTGQTIQIRNLKMEVIYTTEDIYPTAAVKFNNTSFVNRYTVGTGENTQRLQILGDIEDVASELLIDMYGDELKCDIMQVAHHGYGGTVELYRRFSPAVILWPKDQKAVDAQLSGTGYYPEINQSLVNQRNVLLFVVADGGHKTIPLPVIGLTSDRKANHNQFVTAVPRFDGN